MSAINTDTDTILEALNDKLDRDANNLDTSTTNFDVVVDYQVPTAANNYTWYRKYSSGWVEQGGAFATVNSDYHDEIVTLLIEMNSVGYSINVSTATNGNAYVPVIAVKSSSGFTVVRLVNIAAYSATWQVSGMAASN